ncbi:MAG: zinc ribbon domain-containing protein [Candidatus Thermoplasmatota archaeon]
MGKDIGAKGPLTPEEKIKILDNKLLRGEIGEETYLSLVRKYGVKKTTEPMLTLNEKLLLLEERFLLGEISEKVYWHLKEKLEPDITLDMKKEVEKEMEPMDEEKERKKLKKTREVISSARIVINTMERKGMDVKDARRYIQLANSFLKYKNFDRAIKYAKKAEEIARGKVKKEEEKKELVNCPECGEPIKEGWIACPNCGQEL